MKRYARVCGKTALAAAVCLLAASAGCDGRRESAAPPSPTLPNDAASWDSLDLAFTVPDTQDSEARFEFFRTLHKGEDTAVLDGVLERLFPGGVAEPGEAELLRVLSYVAQTTRLEASGRHLGSQVLAEGHAYCYGMARAFEALCRRMGLPARINALHNFEWMQAHNMAEVYYGGAWHLFDPAYGTFFYTRPEYDGQGQIPSARALLSGRAAPDHVFQVCEKLWTGSYDPDWKVRPFPKDFRYGQYSFTVLELYAHVLARTFPFVQSELEMTSFPIDLDMGEKETLEIGKVDGDAMDTFGRLPNGRYPRFYGTPFLGHMRLGPVFHTITIKASKPGRFRMTYHFLPGSRCEAMATVELRDVLIDACESGTDSWSAGFKLQSEEGLFLVINRRGAAYVDAITVSRIE